jgi:thioredoxin 1
MKSSSWIVTLILALFAAYLLYTVLGSKKALGKSPSQLIEQFPDLVQNDKPALIYCYGPKCSACRSMAPNIDAIEESTGRVFKLDISQNMELASALGIRAVPTTLVFKQGKISKSSLGFKSKKALTKMLQP